MLDDLDREGLAENTVVVYTLDQGFFLGDHGRYVKRFMEEESLRMPFLVRWPGENPAGRVVGTMVSNLDVAQTFLDVAGAEAGPAMQGGAGIARGEPMPADWPDARSSHSGKLRSSHDVPAHYGIRLWDHTLRSSSGEALTERLSVLQERYRDER